MAKYSFVADITIKQTVSAHIDFNTLEAKTSRNNYKLDSEFGLDESGSHQIH